ncbi:serine palmitoyltransferase small subunit B isoform X1 [Mastomys coucha]|uniref:serine palmitoyltransferase small subunit B isoform X1 n=1 Tax=Mastomys coucha TaxID=35658 RepID=UPI0012624D6E|nr:serine palmitoyltransferase small subunit B isoform X1 [Mastomys coucha]
MLRARHASPRAAPCVSAAPRRLPAPFPNLPSGHSSANEFPALNWSFSSSAEGGARTPNSGSLSCAQHSGKLTEAGEKPEHLNSLKGRR